MYENAIERNEPGKVNIHRVGYKVESKDVIANVYTPAGYTPSGHYAAVVVNQTAGLYAQRLAESGLVTIAFDARYQGESCGEPRRTDKLANRIGDIKNNLFNGKKPYGKKRMSNLAPNMDEALILDKVSDYCHFLGVPCRNYLMEAIDFTQTRRVPQRRTIFGFYAFTFLEGADGTISYGPDDYHLHTGNLLLIGAGQTVG